MFLRVKNLNKAGLPFSVGRKGVIVKSVEKNLLPLETREPIICQTHECVTT